MRTIKFRGKDEQGQWNYGNLVRYTENDGEQVTCIVSTARCEISAELVFVPVDEKTVGQYIGLKDKNGTEIYEGDVITVDGKYTKLVKYIPEHACFCIASLYDLKTFPNWPEHCVYQQVSFCWWQEFGDEIEVTGNIYDNQELPK